MIAKIGLTVTTTNTEENEMGKIKEALITELPNHPPFGLTVEQLATAQRELTEYARERIYQGEAQYALTYSQGIEHKQPRQLLTDIREEIADAINYLTGLDILVHRIGLDRNQWLSYGLSQGWLDGEQNV